MSVYQVSTRSGRRTPPWTPPAIVVREPESGWWHAHPEPSGPVAAAAVTVAVVGETETRWLPGAVVKRLAELAASDALVVVFGSERRVDGGRDPVVAGLRDHLPRHDVVTVHLVRHRAGNEDTELLRRLVEDARLPVVITSAPAVEDVAAELAGSLNADRMVRVGRTTGGVDVHDIWRRCGPAATTCGTR